MLLFREISISSATDQCPSPKSPANISMQQYVHTQGKPQLARQVPSLLPCPVSPASQRRRTPSLALACNMQHRAGSRPSFAAPGKSPSFAQRPPLQRSGTMVAVPGSQRTLVCRAHRPLLVPSFPTLSFYILPIPNAAFKYYPVVPTTTTTRRPSQFKSWIEIIEPLHFFFRLNWKMWPLGSGQDPTSFLPAWLAVVSSCS